MTPGLALSGEGGRGDGQNENKECDGVKSRSQQQRCPARHSVRHTDPNALVNADLFQLCVRTEKILLVTVTQCREAQAVFKEHAG